MAIISKQTCLYQQLKAYLYQLAIENKSKYNYKFPTEKHLMDKFDISRITAKKAYNDLEQEGIVVRFQGKGTFIKNDFNFEALDFKKPILQSKAKKIGIIIPSIMSTHTSRILNSIRAYFIDNNISDIIIYYDTSEQEQSLEDNAIRNFINNGVDGIIIYPIDGEKNSKLILELALKNFPIILIDRILSGFDFNFVTSDNKLAFEDAIKFVHAKGHDHIALFSANAKTSSTLQARIRGYEQGLKNCNLLIDVNNEIIATPDETNDQMCARLESLILSHTITAIISDCYTSSILLIKTLNKIEMEHPNIFHEIFPLYFELPSDLFAFIKPNPTYIFQNSSEIGYEAAKLLYNLLSDPSTPNQCIKIPCEIREANQKSDL